MEFAYRCSQCGRRFDIQPDIYVCPDCSTLQTDQEPLRGILEVVFSGPVPASMDPLDLLPVAKRHFPSIPVGHTPLWQPQRLRQRYDCPQLYIKDDGLNPTGSFKDRASFLVAAFARRHGIQRVVLASTGNAGSSMAGVGAAAGLQVTLFVPRSAPAAKLVQARQYGARMMLVDGSYDDAYRLSMDFYRRHGGLSRNTAHHPLTIEGKKTVALEICTQLGRAPDHVFVSVGDGVIISGVYKGFADLEKLGRIARVPTVHAVQAENSNALYRAWRSGRFDVARSQTVADSICVDVPKGGYLALERLRTHHGRCVCVTDDEILAAQAELSGTVGLFTEPAGAAAWAGFLKTRPQLPQDALSVILTTGNGLKDTRSAATIFNADPK